MQVPRHACAGAAPLVNADVEALRAHRVFQKLQDRGGLGGKVGVFFGGEIFVFGFVLFGRDQQMAIGVGVAVDDDDAVLAGPEDQAGSFLFGGIGGDRFADEALAGV